jgi:hypothetical protein
MQSGSSGSFGEIYCILHCRGEAMQAANRVIACTAFSPEDGGIKFLQNFDNLLDHMCEIPHCPYRQNLESYVMKLHLWSMYVSTTIFKATEFH